MPLILPVFGKAKLIRVLMPKEEARPGVEIPAVPSDRFAGITGRRAGAPNLGRQFSM